VYKVNDHELLDAKVTFYDGLKPLPAVEEGFAEFGVVHGGLGRVEMIGSSAKEIVYNHP
jgi:hypothetical protein